MFGRRNRFDEVGKSNDSPIRVEYLSLSDFIRQQFLKQRNIFDSTTERPKSAVGKGKILLYERRILNFFFYATILDIVEKHLANQYSTQYENFETKKPRPKTANAAMESTKFYNQDVIIYFIILFYPFHLFLWYFELFVIIIAKTVNEYIFTLPRTGIVS